MRRTKRILALLLAVVMMVGLLAATPLAVSAGDDEPPVEDTLPGEESAVDEPGDEEPVGEEPAVEEPALEEPTGEQPGGEEADEPEDEPEDDAFQIASTLPYVEVGEGGSYNTLAFGIANVKDGGTIKLMTNITTAAGIPDVTGKSFTISLNGKTLNITNSGGYAVNITSGRTLAIAGPGTFNATGRERGISVSDANSKFVTTYVENPDHVATVNVRATAADGVGVHVARKGSASVTTITASGARGVGINVDDGTVTVKNNVTMDGTVTARSYVTAVGTGVIATNVSLVDIEGNINSAPLGVKASGGSRVYVVGSISGVLEVGARPMGLNAPTRKEVTLDAPHNGYYWDEFTNRGVTGVSNPTFVYVRQKIVVGPPDLELISALVTRLYWQAMGRAPDPGGLGDWVTKLSTGRETGASVAYAFFLSQATEDLYAKQTNSQRPAQKGSGDATYWYVERLYRGLLGRPSDPQRVVSLDRFDPIPLNPETNWPREVFYVVQGFIESPEYYEVCAKAGIRIGSSTAPPREHGVPAFVDRVYRVFIGRRGEPWGLNQWTNDLLAGRKTGSSLLEAMVLEPTKREYLDDIYYGKYAVGRSEQEANILYVLDLYEGIFNRTPDSSLELGYVREHAQKITNAVTTATRASGATSATIRTARENAMRSLLKEFTASREFRELCDDYSVKP